MKKKATKTVTKSVRRAGPSSGPKAVGEKPSKAFSLSAGGEQISFRVPKEWLGVADKIAAAAPLGATRTSVFRAALQSGLEALGGKLGGAFGKTAE